MVSIAEVEYVAAVHVMVEGLLNQVLRLVPGQLCHPGGVRGLQELHRSADCFSFKLILVLPTNQVLKGWGGGEMLILETKNGFFYKKKVFEL